MVKKKSERPWPDKGEDAPLLARQQRAGAMTAVVWLHDATTGSGGGETRLSRLMKRLRNW